MTEPYDRDAITKKLEQRSAEMQKLSSGVQVALESGGRAAAIEFLTKETGIDPVEQGKHVYFGDLSIEFSEAGEFVAITAGSGVITTAIEDYSGQDEATDLFKLPANWKLWVGTMSGNPAPLNVAIGIFEDLQVQQTTTPFEIEFTAYQFTAMFGLKDSEEEIAAEVWSDCFGEHQNVGGGSGGKAFHFVFSELGCTSGSGF